MVPSTLVGGLQLVAFGRRRRICGRIFAAKVQLDTIWAKKAISGCLVDIMTTLGFGWGCRLPSNLLGPLPIRLPFFQSPFRTYYRAAKIATRLKSGIG
eukprot:scaffold6681_cov67-Skeletonema_dohrnii-CCMP3373.AAC.1